MFEEEHRSKCITCRTYSGKIQLCATVFLTMLKLTIGVIGNSKGLLADAVHSSANMLTSGAIFISHKYGDEAPDDEHPFGHGKIEYVTSAGVSLGLIIGTFYIVFKSLDGIIHGHPMGAPHWSVIIVALISIIVNETLYHYLQCVGKEFTSSILLTNSWAIRSDSFSSMAVIAGVIAARFGFTHADGYVALAIAAIMIWICGNLLIQSVMSLMDKSIPFNELEDIRSTISQVTGKKNMTTKARYNGRKIIVDVTLTMRKQSSITQFNKIRKDIELVVYNNHRNVELILVDYDL